MCVRKRVWGCLGWCARGSKVVLWMAEDSIVPGVRLSDEEARWEPGGKDPLTVQGSGMRPFIDQSVRPPRLVPDTADQGIRWWRHQRIERPRGVVWLVASAVADEWAEALYMRAWTRNPRDAWGGGEVRRARGRRSASPTGTVPASTGTNSTSAPDTRRHRMTGTTRHTSWPIAHGHATHSGGFNIVRAVMPPFGRFQYRSGGWRLCGFLAVY
ncbi:hypothetical protein BLEM_0456 [Bifidobacterium lemurum]|uniref:Uncharacterized protein n=1 Tax=Bifidobacterium lemurum TaxID=1603886 RepID=A0A261FVJ1_9BIFI|nr:hypothetical protein BLEM_0456 [Bifidobacterium lemurum]